MHQNHRVDKEINDNKHLGGGGYIFSYVGLVGPVLS